MAMMIPDLNPDDIPYDSERLVYIALRDQLPNEYTALHSYPWLRPDREGALREGEADFVVIHPVRGMLVLEVKGGELRYRRGHWERVLENGVKRITDPFKQARQSMHTLIKQIEKRSEGDILKSYFTHGYAVVFPHDNYSGPEPPGSDPAIIITRREMGNMHQAIESAFDKWPGRDQPLTNHQWTRFTSGLLPEFKLYRPIAATAEDIRRAVQEMTDDQMDVLRGLYAGNRRVYVQGVAGSGKTQLALDRAVNLAERSVPTLFLCYNKFLAENLRTQFENSSWYRSCRNHLTIHHFHGLARELVEDAEMEWNPPEAELEKQVFFAETVPSLMEQAVYLLLGQGKDPQFEAIVLDEAQDFHALWWEVLQVILLKNPDEGEFYAFGDPVQKLWDWAPDNPPVEFPTRYSLQHNCRNSRWIAKTSNLLAGTETRFFKRSPLGGKPKIDEVPSTAAMKGAVMETVKKLIDQHDLSPSQIVCIGPSAKQNSSLATVKAIQEIPLTDSIQAWQAGNGILVTTARSFKGLETDVVVVYDLVHQSKTFTLVDLYVACTRARSHVHFLVVGKEFTPTIQEAISKVQQELG